MLDCLLTPLITPYNYHNRLELTSLKHLLEHLIRTKTKTVVLGTPLGEGTLLTPYERKIIIDKTIDYSHDRLKVFVMVDMDYLTEDELEILETLAVDGYFLQYPLKLENELEKTVLDHHFSRLLTETDRTVIVDLRNKTNDKQKNKQDRNEPVTDDERFIHWIEKISQYKNIVGVICDDETTINQLTKMNQSFRIYFSDVNNAIKLLRAGAEGIYSGINHVYGETLHTLVQLAKKNQWQEAELLWDVYSEKFKLLSPEHPSHLKAILNYLGYRVGSVRLPLKKLSSKDQHQLIKTLCL